MMNLSFYIKEENNIIDYIDRSYIESLESFNLINDINDDFYTLEKLIDTHDNLLILSDCVKNNISIEKFNEIMNKYQLEKRFYSIEKIGKTIKNVWKKILDFFRNMMKKIKSYFTSEHNKIGVAIVSLENALETLNKYSSGAVAKRDFKYDATKYFYDPNPHNLEEFYEYIYLINDAFDPLNTSNNTLIKTTESVMSQYNLLKTVSEEENKKNIQSLIEHIKGMLNPKYDVLPGLNRIRHPYVDTIPNSIKSKYPEYKVINKYGIFIHNKAIYKLIDEKEWWKNKYVTGNNNDYSESEKEKLKTTTSPINISMLKFIINQTKNASENIQNKWKDFEKELTKNKEIAEQFLLKLNNDPDFDKLNPELKILYRNYMLFAIREMKSPYYDILVNISPTIHATLKLVKENLECYDLKEK